MKKVLLVFAVVAASFAANAQSSGSTTGFKVGGGLRLGMPIGDFGDIQGFGIGAELLGEYHFTPMVSATINSGYTRFSGKDYDFGGVTFEGESVGYIPVQAGVRVYPSTNFFIGGRAGVGIFTGDGSSSSGFSYEPQIGFNGSKFQLALGYNGWSKDGGSLNHLGLSAIFKFN